MKRNIFFILLFLSLIGTLDAGYLTYEHYNNSIPPCTVNRFLTILSDCGVVLKSNYSVVYGVPLALLGLIHYGIFSLIIFLAIKTNKKLLWFLTLYDSLIGAIASAYFMYLQFIVIKSFCVYCTFSALISFALFFLAFSWLKFERKATFIYATALKYRFILKPILFLTDPERIHIFMTSFGELLGKIKPAKYMLKATLCSPPQPILMQRVAGIPFENPVGLSAGFDYEAKLTQILPSIGFGFETVGTITNLPYIGNPPPMLGRLPKSRSLMVNKGFKNDGASAVIRKLESLDFEIPIGISIGRTNGKKSMTQNQSVADVTHAFSLFEKSKVKHAYYELNISCPNLYGNISFYPLPNLKELLTELEKLHIKKPVFAKMPIEKDDKETMKMLEVIAQYPIAGVIFGNLQKNRKDPSLDPEEVKRFPIGYFSGKPTERRSNELIKLAYLEYHKKFVIIGCGGIFSAKDAYRKIRLGASLLQLITGMIYQGPQLISQINLELADLLEKDGFKHISEAVGVDA